MKYALIFLAFALACCFVALTQTSAPLRVMALSFALAFGGVGLAYAGVGSRAFLKRADGRLHPLSWLIYWPYHALNTLSLWGFRRSARENAWDEIAPNLYLGCRLNARDNAAIERLGIASVLDLTAEFGETARLRNLNYRCIPLLDTRAPTLEQLQTGAIWIENALETGPVYVHCALGHGRSSTFVAAYLILAGRAPNAEEAVAKIKRLRPRIGLTRAQMAVLQSYASARKSAL